MALTEKDRKQLLAFLIILAVGFVVLFWMMWRDPKVQEANQLQQQIDSLERRVDSARRVLAQGTIETLRQRIADYEASLVLMRRLVPEENEIAGLIDDIASRAGLRGVEIGQFNPMTREAGAAFDIYRYRLNVFGHYDEIGEFLSDVASLPRIMVPYQVSLTRASPTAQQTYSDTTGGLLEAQFLLRTFVTQQAAGGETGASP